MVDLIDTPSESRTRMTLDVNAYESIMAYLNNHRKSTILLLAIDEPDSLEREYKVVGLTKDYFEIATPVTIGRKNKRTYFHKPIETSADVKDRFSFLHERATHITYPTFVEAVLLTLLWITFYLPYAHRYLIPSLIEPLCPSPPAAGWILLVLLMTHFFEGMLVLYKLGHAKVSNTTMFIWWILTIYFGLPITRKAIYIHKIHMRSLKSV